MFEVEEKSGRRKVDVTPRKVLFAFNTKNAGAAQNFLQVVRARVKESNPVLLPDDACVVTFLLESRFAHRVYQFVSTWMFMEKFQIVSMHVVPQKESGTGYEYSEEN